MNELHSLELFINLLFQSFGTWLSIPAKALSFLGTEEFYLIVMPALFWCVSPRIGLRTAVLLVVSSSMNYGLKIAFHSPRPFWVDTAVKAYSSEPTFGFPSGHAQNAAAIWGFFATTLRRKWIFIACIVVIALIGLSRIYLGMHFLTDVIAGWSIGLLILWVWNRLDGPIASWVKTSQFSTLALASVLGAFIIGGVVALPWAMVQNWPIPSNWVANAHLADPGGSFAPLSLEHAFTFSGLWLGVMMGAAWKEKKNGGYVLPGSTRVKILRYAIGMVGILILWYGLGKVFPRDTSLIAYGLRFLRYLLVSLWVSALAPILFDRLNLTR